MKLFLSSALFFAVASFAPLALGQNTIWNNTGTDNSFENGSNWSNGVPIGGTSTYIFPGASATQLLPNTYFLGGPSNITINASSSHATDRILIVNGFAGTTTTMGTVTLTFATGTTFTVGSSLEVSGGEVLNYSGNLVLQSGSIDLGTASNYTTGPGTLNLTSGTFDVSLGAMDIGATAGSTGTFNQNGSSTVLVSQFNLGTNGGKGIYSIAGSGNNFTLVAGGVVQMGNATFTQNDSTSTVDFSGSGLTSELGLISGDKATYNLQAGNLITGPFILGLVSNATGTLNQTGGTLSATNLFEVGSFGTGNYTLSGGSADFQSGFTVGLAAGSAGTVTQSGSTMLTAEGVVTIGASGTGTYNLSGGTATFNSGVVVGATGIVNQTGGTFIIPTGQTLDLSAVGSSYTLGGGILQIGDSALTGLTSGEGMLNFAGGTLQITSTTAGAFTDPLDGTLTGTSTIDAATTPGITTVTMAGNLSGTGGLTFTGTAGTTIFSLTGNDTYTGTTTITSGTLNLQPNASNVISSTFLNIGATGVLNLNLNAGGLAYTGGIGGTGALNINFNTPGDPFVVLNTSTFTGPIILGNNGISGNLQVYSGTFGNISDNGTASGVTIGGAPLAPFPGGTVIPTTGVVTFGNNTYTGLTTINPGFTLYANNLGGSVINNGTLGIVPTTAVGSTFAINGDFQQTSGGGSLVVRVNGNQSDQYTATTAELFGTIRVSGLTTAAPQTHVIVTTGGLSTGVLNSSGPGGLQTVSGFLLSTTLALDANPNDLDLIVHANPIMGQTPNQNAVAAALNANPFNPIFGVINSNLNLTAADAPAILESLTPESLQYARMISFENSNLLAIRMNGFDADLRAGYGGLDTNAVNIVTPGFSSSLGRSLGSLLAYDPPSFHNTAPNGVNYYPGGGGGTSTGGGEESTSSPSAAPNWDSSSQVISDSPNPYMATQKPSGPETPGLTEFIGGDAVLADLNQNQSAANAPSSKASYTAADVAAGVAFRMNSHLAAGVLFNYNHTDARTDASGSKTKVDTYSPGLFATFSDHGFYANGLFSFGYNNYTNERNIAFLGNTATSKPHGQQYVGDLDVGYDFHPDKHWVVGPTLGATYTHLDIDSFTETGASPADLTVNSQSADSLRSRLGAHAIFATFTGDVLLQPNISLMWQHEYLDDSSGITSSFNDFSTNPFTIQTAAPSRDSALIACGLTATLSNSMALYLNYIADAGASDYFVQSVVGGFKTRF